MSKASDNQDYDFGPFEDDYRSFGPGEGEGARGPLILALAGGLLLIFGAVIWNTYKQGVREDAGALPIVYADASPYKRAPENPGGTVVPDQDRTLYDVLDGSKRDLPPLADPEIVEEVLQGGPPLELRYGDETDLDEASGIPKAILKQVTEYDDLNKLPDAPPELESETVPEPSLTLPSQQFGFQNSGNYLVQIAALRTEAAADKAWVQAVSAEPAMFTGAQKRVQRADLGAKGVFYRLRVGAFGERPDAVSFCDELKERGKACIVVSG